MVIKTVKSNVARKYDVVLYGATGFVGRQTVAYFAKLPAALQRQLRWAIAGRSAGKLQEVKTACGAGARNADVIVADALDVAALNELAKNTAVVLSTAGPFAIFGSELVAACVRNGTHYVDITGETPWVREMIEQYQDQAVKTGARIIPFCGFDSVPSDLGAWLMTQAMQAQHGEECVSVKSAVSMRGGVNGGTLASGLNMLASDAVKDFAQPFLLNPKGTQPKDKSAHEDPVLPVNDPDFRAWLVPFVMGPINTRVVRRSAALLGYGKNFHYQEYMRIGKGPIAAAAAASFSLGMASSKLMVKLPGVKQVTEKLMPGPGQGPSESAMNNGSYRCELVAKSASGKMLRGKIADSGDPGNRATTKMVCESALCLALQFDELPDAAGSAGFLTPASGLGDVLVERLRAAGMTLKAGIK
ncbi:MAG: saccharopine dehydrogenase NADP-binding domain-containing protein [Rhodocyclaceae bacterium]|nr:saccharopine dehydrogenase NADP-binding domain-containing protein [Rhodocyclaceae bacterium]